MESKIRVGVIGTSWFADLFHLPQIQGHPDAVLAAICGRNRERAEEMAAKYGIPRVFTDYRELIQHGEVDAVVVVTPDYLHYPMTMEALRAGKHVLCEKPLATSSRQAQEMYETAEQAGVVHMTVFTWRWAPEMQYMAELVAQGRIGKVYHGEFNFLSGYALDPAHTGWRFDASQGGGALTDVGAHAADLARLLVGEVRQVAGAARMLVERANPAAQPSNDAAVVLLEFESGALATMQLSHIATLPAETGFVIQARLYGSAGMLDAKVSNAGGLTGTRGADHPLETHEIPASFLHNADPAKPSFPRLLDIFTSSPVGGRLFIESIRDNQHPAPSFYEGWKAQQVLDAAAESNRSGRWVAVNPPAGR